MSLVVSTVPLSTECNSYLAISTPFVRQLVYKSDFSVTIQWLVFSVSAFYFVLDPESLSRHLQLLHSHDFSTSALQKQEEQDASPSVTRHQNIYLLLERQRFVPRLLSSPRVSSASTFHCCKHAEMYGDTETLGLHHQCLHAKVCFQSAAPLWQAAEKGLLSTILL